LARSDDTSRGCSLRITYSGSVDIDFNEYEPVVVRLFPKRTDQLFPNIQMRISFGPALRLNGELPSGLIAGGGESTMRPPKRVSVLIADRCLPLRGKASSLLPTIRCSKFVIGEENRGLSVPIINRGSNPDSNSADDASGANDNDGSARSSRRSNKACIVGIPD
jgi:hypothetical protein